ncbi:PREDICTED: zinc finger CCCH domain-containing protein 17-like [Camelina sativa]|uniref:Zinc finger CCCH domain-containing protein 17-like n=1 Tax=Camelina sativa TaxID=90675 RepID=A0ABM0TE26_CAMSA|nr:PREDICTED: zinc finger CCCH domain-containing protein 17-like [Camelina sativa]
MFAPATATQPQQHQQPQQKQKQSEISSAAEEALKWNTDCVYFLASPLTCKKGPECEYRHSEYARMNPRDCYYWLNGNCMNPKCGFRHPPLEGLLGIQGGAPAGSVQPTHATAQGVAKQPVPCVFFQKGMCVKGDMCSFLHTPNPAAYKKQHPVEAKPATDPQISKKPAESNTGEKKFLDASLSMVVKARTDISAAPRVASAGLRDNRSVEGYVPKHAGYEPVVQRKGAGAPSFSEGGRPTQFLHKYGSDDNNSFHNGKDADDVLRESSPGFDVLVDNEAGDTEYYHVEDRYRRRSQEGGNPEYDPDFSSIADGDREGFRDQREYAWGHRRVSSERGDRLDRRVYAEDERSENIQESDLRYRLAKQRKGNGMRSVGSHDYAAPESSMDRGYRDSRRDTHRENSISSSRLQGRIKLRERSNGEEGHFDRRSERGRDRSELSSQGRLRDRIKGRLEENHTGIQKRELRAPWARRRELEEERKLTPISIAETRSSKVESKPDQQSLGKRKSLEEDHHSYKRSGDSFAAPLPFSEILKRKRAAASGGRSNETISKEDARDETKLIAEEKTEVVSEPNPPHEAEVEEGTVMEEEEVVGEEEVYEGNEEDQAYEGDELNGEYYYEEGYEEEGGEYAYEEGEEVVYAAEEGEEEATEGGEEDIEEKTVEMLS